MRKQLWILCSLLLVFVLAIVFVERTFSPSFQQCIERDPSAEKANTPKKENATGQSSVVVAYVQCTGQFLDDSEGTITAIATIIIAAFTGTLWFATSEQGRLTEEALIVGRRSFVFAKSLIAKWDLVNGQYHWRLSTVWENSGETPTRNLQFYSDCFLSNIRLPNTFDFNQSDPNAPPGPGMLGPKTSSQAGNSPHSPHRGITPQDILDIQAGNKSLYLWGWARYNDAFQNTELHITRYCWQILIVGNPDTFDPTIDPNSITFFNVHQSRGNCADDECALQGLP